MLLINNESSTMHDFLHIVFGICHESGFRIRKVLNFTTQNTSSMI
jgi:hypothetical protein